MIDLIGKHINIKMDYANEMDFLVRNEARNKFIKNLTLSLDGNRLVLFQYVDKHGNILYDMLKNEGVPCYFIHGGIDGEEREEIRKILLRITDVLRGNIEGLKDTAEAVIEVDFLNSKAEFGAANNCSVPKVNEKEYLKLVNARHPLLEPEKVVPVTFEIGKDYNIMLITGPNTGGKTVTMKSAGLISTMALSGIPVPASEVS